MDSLTLRRMIVYAETAIRWANEAGGGTVEDELPGKLVRWKATLAAVEATESSRDA